MVTTLRDGAPRGPERHASRGRLARELRWEWMGDEGRALASSYAAALALALAWLVVVRLTPIPAAPVNSEPPFDIEWRDPVPRDPTIYGATGGGPGATRSPTRALRDAGSAVATAFQRGAGTVVDALGALRGVAVTRAGETPATTAAKVVLPMGEAGVGSRRPGLDSLGGSPAGALGAVAGGAGDLRRVGASVSLPPVVVAPPAHGARGMGELGVAVRSRAAQLENCYEREGRSRNPELAGTVVVSATISGSGEVTAAEIARRSWSGPGAAETEACIVSVVRAWRFPAAGEPTGTYAFPVSFTAGK